MPTALISGITGQDGSYLAELLLAKGYKVHGIVRRASTNNLERIKHLEIPLHFGDLCDSGSLRRILDLSQPGEVYNLGAMSHVRVSFDEPVYTAQATGESAIAFLEAVRQTGAPIRYYQASSSEMFGSAPPPQSENTVFHPRSPYGCAKVFAYHATVNYREAYGMHASNGILFNHESPRRGETFVTRKITKAIARIYRGRQTTLELGNLDAKRDWGFAGDFVEAMWLMLQRDQPNDYVVATGETHSVQEFVEKAFSYVGLDWKKHVVINPALYRPAEVDVLLGDASKARRLLGWKPQVGFERLISMMVEADTSAEAA
jgi:GDPmannose 4,6-dehydratase